MNAKSDQTAVTPTRRPWVRTILAGALLASALFFFFLPDFIGRTLNAIHDPSLKGLDTAASQSNLLIADMHADTLLWNRDPYLHGRYGHVDFPRMLEAGMGLQVFSTVTKTPRGLNFERNAATSDNITLLVVAQRWPVRTWRSLSERALYQATRLRRLAERSDGQFFILEHRNDLLHYLERRENGAALTAGLLAIEGLHALEGDLHNLERFYAAGFRMMGLTHFFDNALGGSAHGIDKGGLTAFGRSTVAELERLGIIVDLAHASPQLFADVLAQTSRPLVVSHTGVKGTCDRTRNLSDDQLRAVAANGGLVGIAFFNEAVCGRDLESVVAAIVYSARLIGVEHIALGSDFDGAVATPFDVTGLPRLGAALSRAGFSADEVHALMGGNVFELLKTALPDE